MIPDRPNGPSGGAFERWIERLEQRHLADRTFPEVRRALQALSSLYVERRGRLARGAALDGAGKRAAFALFYGPIHHRIVDHLVRELELARAPLATVHDHGCGTGVAGAAWAANAAPPARVRGTDLNPWAVAEAARTYADLGLDGSARRGRVERARPGAGRDQAVVAGWVVNELDDRSRDALRDGLLAAAERGTRVLIVEPIARRPVPWWDDWERAFARAGGRSDLWRLPADLPAIVARLDRAAGLSHRKLTARSLALGAKPAQGVGAP